MSTENNARREENKKTSNASTMFIPLYNNGCLSILAKKFASRVIYAQITRDEALNACENISNHSAIARSKEGQLSHYLLHSLIQNKVLITCSKSIFFIQDTSLQGILIDFADCYSPLCKASDRGCYSPTCSKRHLDHLQLVTDDCSLKSEDTSIPEILECIPNNLPHKEKKRQLAIEELRNYEDNFLRQLNVIRDIFAQPLLLSSTAIEESRRHLFHDILFGNYLALATLHKGIFRDLELSRDKMNHYLFPNSIIIGKLLVKHFLRLLDPYVLYVTNYVAAKYQYDSEYHRNSAFQQFVQQQENKEREFRITLKGLLISPIVRIAKYDLLFTTILNNSKEEEQGHLKELIDISKNIVSKVNEATRIAEAEYRITEIRAGLRIRQPNLLRQSFRDQQIISGDAHLLFEGQVDSIKLPPIPPTTCQLFLFSHALVITRKKMNANGQEEYILVDKPIPLPMLCIGKVSRSSFRVAVHQQANILSSIRRQWSNSKFNYQRCSIESSRLIKSPPPNEESITTSDDSQLSLFSDSSSLTGLKIRHRIKSFQKKIKRTNSIKDTLYFSNSNRRSNSWPFPLPRQSSCRSPRLQKSATYPSSLTVPQPRIARSRLLSLSHMADPTLNYLFECPTVDDRLLWRSKIKSALPKAGPFELSTLCAIVEYSNAHSANRRFNIGCGTIWCSLYFKSPSGQNMIALGTRYGVWVAKEDGQEPFKQILPFNCQQLELFDEQILLIKTHKPSRILGGIHINHICSLWQSAPQMSNMGLLRPEPSFLRYFKTIHHVGVVNFAIGTLRGNRILCYLRRRRTGSIRLVLMFYRADNDLAAPWFVKLKEYKPLFIQPSELRIAHDFAFIRSRSEGVEKIDLYSWISESVSLTSSLRSLSLSNVNKFQHPRYSSQIDLPVPLASVPIKHQQVGDPALTVVGFIPLDQKDSGIICSGKSAYSINDTTSLLPQEIEFEAESKAVAVFYPYLISFSSHVIEIRHLETSALIQAIPGRKIRCVHVCYSDESPYTQASTIHVAMFHPDVNQTKVYQMRLKELSS